MFSGFDPDAYNRALAADRVVAMNAGLGASSVVEHLEILSRALSATIRSALRSTDFSTFSSRTRR